MGRLAVRRTALPFAGVVLQQQSFFHSKLLISSPKSEPTEFISNTLNFTQIVRFLKLCHERSSVLCQTEFQTYTKREEGSLALMADSGRLP